MLAGMRSRRILAVLVLAALVAGGAAPRRPSPGAGPLTSASTRRRSVAPPGVADQFEAQFCGGTLIHAVVGR